MFHLSGIQDEITIAKAREHFQVLHNMLGRVGVHKIDHDEAEAAPEVSAAGDVGACAGPDLNVGANE